MNAAESFAWCMLQVTLFATAASIVYAFVRRQRSSRNVALLAGSLAVVGLLTVASFSRWPRWGLSLDTSTRQLANVETPTADAADLAVEPVAADDLTDRPRGAEETDALPLLLGESIHSMATDSTSSLAFDESSLAGPKRPAWYWLVIVAWTGAAFGIARLLVGSVFVRRYRQLSAPIEDEALQQMFRAVQAELSVAANIELRECAALNVAATIGWRRPLILLPAAWRAWSAAERRAVLAHELAHVAERHFPLWLVGQLATVPHFYHPLVHWLGRRLRLEQELAADALAASVFDDRRQYTNALAGLALGSPRPAAALAGLGLFMSRPLLMRRIAMLRHPTAEKRRPSRAVRALSLLALALTVAIVIGLRGPASIAAANDDESAAEPLATDSGGRPPVDAASDSTPANVESTTRDATALILVSSEPLSVLGEASGEQSWRVFSRTQAALLGSKVVIQSALGQAEIAKLPLVAALDDPVRTIHARLSVGFIPDSEIIHVRLVGSPQEYDQMRKIVDAIVQEYMERFVAGDRDRRLATRDALARSLAALQEEITAIMEQQNALATELGVARGANEPDAESELLMREIADAIRAKTEINGRLAEQQSDYLVARERLGRPTDVDAEVAEKLDSDRGLAILAQQLLDARQTLDDLASRAEQTETDESEAIARQQQRVVDIQQRIEERNAELKVQFKTELERNLRAELQAVKEEYQIRTHLLTQQIKALDALLQERTAKLLAKGEQSVELDVMAAEVAQLQEVARELMFKLEAMDIQSNLPARVRVIQNAM